MKEPLLKVIAAMFIAIGIILCILIAGILTGCYPGKIKGESDECYRWRVCMYEMKEGDKSHCVPVYQDCAKTATYDKCDGSPDFDQSCWDKLK